VLRRKKDKRGENKGCGCEYTEEDQKYVKVVRGGKKPAKVNK